MPLFCISNAKILLYITVLLPHVIHPVSVAVISVDIVKAESHRSTEEEEEEEAEGVLLFMQIQAVFGVSGLVGGGGG